MKCPQSSKNTNRSGNKRTFTALLSLLLAAALLLGMTGCGSEEDGAGTAVSLSTRESVNQLPAPDVYWQAEGSCTTKSNYSMYKFTFESDPTELTADYAATLVRYGMAVQSSDSEGSYDLQMPNDESLWVNITCRYSTSSEKWTVSVSCGSAVELLPLEIQGQERPENTAAFTEEAPVTFPEEAPVITVDGPVLPHPGMFFVCGINEETWTSEFDCWKLLYQFDSIGAEEAMNEYVSLLKSSEYSLTQIDSDITDAMGAIGFMSYMYFFDYTGSENVGQFTSSIFTDADVVLLVNINYASGYADFALYYGDGFTLVNPGVISSVELTGYNGSGSDSGSSSGTDPEYGSALECTTCRGSGKCKECGGDGYVWSSASDSENRLCPKCNGSRNCTDCNGSGKRY